MRADALAAEHSDLKPLDGRYSTQYTDIMPGEERFAEVKAMLERAGYQLARIHGSHHYFNKPGEQPLSIPVHHGKVKPYYVLQVERICEGD